jgi:hypothetical protein
MATPLTDDQKIFLMKLVIGDVPNNPFYPMFSNDEYLAFLNYTNGVVQRAIRMAAIGASMMLATINYKEVVGDEQIWSNVSRDYQKALKDLISESAINALPDGIMPYASGISWQDIHANNNNPDNVRPELTKINIQQHYLVFGNRRVLEWPLVIV